MLLFFSQSLLFFHLQKGNKIVNIHLHDAAKVIPATSVT
uniref:Uncharacterized protein n=1 Tax=Rhizophora mucronata TaxID=61149 RepID=A0A2P2J375_RHIMU